MDATLLSNYNRGMKNEDQHTLDWYKFHIRWKAGELESLHKKFLSNPTQRSLESVELKNTEYLALCRAFFHYKQG